MRFIMALTVPLSIAACAPLPTDPTATTLPFFGAGYPEAGDPCRRLGEAAVTAEYLDHTADLIGCPADMETLDAFIADTGAKEAFRQDGYVVLSVPLGG